LVPIDLDIGCLHCFGNRSISPDRVISHNRVINRDRNRGIGILKRTEPILELNNRGSIGFTVVTTKR
jgi:hypothetical protein